MQNTGVSIALAGGLFVLGISLLQATSPMGSVVGLEANTLTSVDTVTSGNVLVGDETTDVYTGTYTEPVVSTSADTTNVVVEKTSEPVVSEPVVATVVEDVYSTIHKKCPFPAQTGRTILDFTEGGSVVASDLLLTANATEDKATHSLSRQYVEPGVYDISLASFDVHREFPEEDSFKEQWMLGVYDLNAKRLFVTPQTRDMRPDEDLVIERVAKGVQVPEKVYRVTARHYAYPDREAHGVVPLCVAFDRIEPVVELTNETVLVNEKVVVDGAVSEETAVLEPVTDVANVERADSTGVVPVSEEDSTAVRLPELASCPLPVRTGRTIVDFTKKGTVPLQDLIVVANGTKVSATMGPVPTYIQPGAYAVRLASHRVAEGAVGLVEPRWFGELFDANGVRVLKTAPAKPVPAWEEEFVSLVSEKVVVPETGVRFAGMHTAYPSKESASVVVLCAGFDRLDADGGVDAQIQTPVAVPSVPVTDAVSIQQQDEVMGTARVDVSTGLSERVVEVAPRDVGVTSALRAVGVADPGIALRRKAVADMVEKDVFTTLSTASTKERGKLVQALVQQEGQTESETRQETAPTLVRAVYEEHVRVQTEVGESVRAERTESILVRAGVAAFRDTDGDGVSDYDEERLYDTDPENPFTGGGVLTDGERILLGLNPHATDTVPVVVESPKGTGVVVEDLFTLDLPYIVAHPSAHVLDTQDMYDGATTSIRVTGTTKPLAFVTLYMYSTPIVVTVRADNSGRFEYTYDETLEDGAHELYVATVDGSGKILAKSEPLPFIKTAQAVEEMPLLASVDPVEKSAQTSVTFALLSILVVALGAIVFLGVWASRHEQEEVKVAPHE